MTNNQIQTHWEMCRQGFPLVADDAMRAWEAGEPFTPPEGVQIPRKLKALIEQRNWEVKPSLEVVV